jgi:Sortase domain
MTVSSRRWRGLRGVTLATGAACLVAAGFLVWRHWPHPVDVGTVPNHPAPVSLAPAMQTIDVQQANRPSLLRIPALGVSAPIAPVVADQDGALGVPDDPGVLGWWSDGPVPGAPLGTAVIDGHVDTAASGPGALFRLRTLKPGDEIDVIDGSRSIVFQVVALREYPKAALAGAGVFNQAVAGRLALITCGGRFDSHMHHYDDNVVAFAVPKPI